LEISEYDDSILTFSILVAQKVIFSLLDTWVLLSHRYEMHSEKLSGKGIAY